MSVSFLATRPVDDGGLAGQIGGGGVHKKLDLEMRCQEEEQWCWAAVTQLVDRWKGGSHSQSEIASHHIAPNGGLICSSPLGGDDGSTCTGCGEGCGGAHLLSEVLAGRGALKTQPPVNRPPSFKEVKDAIGDERPLPVRIDWGDASGNAGHFVCVVGYSEDEGGSRWVEVFDPLWPAMRSATAEVITMRFDDFVSEAGYAAASNSGGSINYTYEVR